MTMQPRGHRHDREVRNVMGVDCRLHQQTRDLLTRDRLAPALRPACW